MKYIWLDESPILQQVSNDFKSAAILFHPFVQMPKNWTENKKSRPFEHVYPTIEEQLQYGQPIQWDEIMKMTGLSSYKDIAISLMTSISAFTPSFANEDFAKKLHDGINQDLYYPNEDTTSVFMFENVIKLLKNTGTTTIQYFAPVSDIEESLDIASVSAKQLASTAEREILITDANNELAFLSIVDSFTTIMLYKHNDIEKLAKQNFEHIICDNETTVNWYFQK